MATLDPDFINIPASRTSNTGSKILDSIEERMPISHIYQNSNDRENWVHEATHGLNSQIRNQTPPGDNAFYVLNGKAIILKEPRFRLSQIIPFVQVKGPVFQLYLGTQLQYWDDTPTYVLDEWVAYTNGAEYLIEVGDNNGHPCEKALEFCFYATALIHAVDRYDPSYPDKEKLHQFVSWQIERVFLIYERTPNKTANSQKFYEEFNRRLISNDK